MGLLNLAGGELRNVDGTSYRISRSPLALRTFSISRSPPAHASHGPAVSLRARSHWKHISKLAQLCGIVSRATHGSTLPPPAMKIEFQTETLPSAG